MHCSRQKVWRLVLLWLILTIEIWDVVWIKNDFIEKLFTVGVYNKYNWWYYEYKEIKIKLLSDIWKPIMVRDLICQKGYWYENRF